MTLRRTSLFPHMPRSKKFVDSDDEIVEHWSLSLMNLYQTLQTNFRSTGYLLPNLSAADIADFREQFAPYDLKMLPPALANNRGLTAFDIDNNVPKVFIISYNPDNTLDFATTNWKTYQLV